MLSLGKHITTLGDALIKVSLDSIYYSIKSPSKDTECLIRQLRLISEMDRKQYNELKKKLPYIVCAHFSPPFRKTDNFIYTEYFIIDIDHISEKGFILNQIKELICKDNRVTLCFISPGEDGLKVLFKLKNKCYDFGLYSIFYKIFASEFSKKYFLDQIIDTRTADVCRACFLSEDESVYYNPISAPIDIETYISPNDIYNTRCKIHEIMSIEKELSNENVNVKEAIPDDIFQKIRIQLNPESKKKIEKEKNIYIPPELDKIADSIKEKLEMCSIEICEIVNINYGKKYRLKYLNLKAEVNLFYGKRGFAIVESPKTGTDNELNKLVAQLIASVVL